MKKIIQHTPVLLNEVVQTLNPKDSGIYIDATFGTGGHTTLILENSSCKVIGLDCDHNSFTYSNHLKKIYEKRFTFIHDNFKNIDSILKKLNISTINGIIFDLGISSVQLDDKKRGFSFLGDGPLDMRMDNTLLVSAKKLINTINEEALANLIYYYGGERRSRYIAKNIVKFRQKKVIESTSQLVKAIGINYYNDRIHFATRTFQALRIAINNELENLKVSLNKIPRLLSNNSTIAIVTFHSLEDKIVKDCFNHLSQGKQFKKINQRVITPTTNEIKDNPRARSAKLRGLQKLI